MNHRSAYVDRLNSCPSVRGQASDMAIPMVSISDLIKMKQSSDREQDKADIEGLKKILNEK